MITIAGDEAEIVFPWPTNDTAGNLLIMMTKNASNALAVTGRRVIGRPRFWDLRRTETGFEFVFTAKLHPLTEPEEVPGE